MPNLKCDSIFLETSMNNHVMILFRAARQAPFLIVAFYLSYSSRHQIYAYGPSQLGTGANQRVMTLTMIDLLSVSEMVEF